VASIAGLREVLLVAALAENLLLLKHEGGVVQLLVTAAAGEVLRVPHLAHCTRKWTSVCEGEGEGQGEWRRRAGRVEEKGREEGWEGVESGGKGGAMGGYGE